MKPIVLVLLVAATPALAQRIGPGEAKRKMDAKYGFRDVRFETDTIAIAGLHREFKVQATTYYSRPADNLAVGTATLKSLLYGFVEGKLSEVVLKTAGFVNTTPVREAFQAEYGDGCSVCGGTGDYLWGSDKERISIDVNQFSGDALTTIYSKPMAKVEAAAKKRAGKKAAGDL